MLSLRHPASQTVVSKQLAQTLTIYQDPVVSNIVFMQTQYCCTMCKCPNLQPAHLLMYLPELMGQGYDATEHSRSDSFIASRPPYVDSLDMRDC